MKTFSYCLVTHIAGIVLCTAGGIYSAQHQLLFCTILCVLACIGLACSLYRIHTRQIRMLQRTVDCLKRKDLNSIVCPAFKDRNIARLASDLTDVVRELRTGIVNEEAKYQYYVNLLERVDTAVVVCDREGRTEWMNRAATELLGDTPVLPDDIAQAISGGKQVIHRDGNPVGKDLALSASRLVIKGKERRIICLNNIHSALEKTEMEAWQKLIRVLTHEIMNSITPIISLSDTLCERSRELSHDEHTQAAISQGLSIIHRRCKGLMEFVENYRKLTRIAAPVKTKIGVDAFFRDLKGLSAQPFITFRTAAEGMYWHADRAQMEQVFLNIIKNATEACKEKENPQIEVEAQYTPDGKSIRFTISDNGEGILPEVKERIFVPFFTTKPNGSGIGLSLCKQIITLHEGHIYVESETGKGTRFTILLGKE